jgi:hypothetical protein
MIEKNRVIDLHRSQIIACLKIADARPGSAAFLQKV